MLFSGKIWYLLETVGCVLENVATYNILVLIGENRHLLDVAECWCLVEHTCSQR